MMRYEEEEGDFQFIREKEKIDLVASPDLYYL
jgi:hypothetical protein